MNYANFIPKRFYNVKLISVGTTSLVYSAKDREDFHSNKIIKMTKSVEKYNFVDEVNILKLILHINSNYFIKYLGKIINKNNIIERSRSPLPISESKSQESRLGTSQEPRIGSIQEPRLGSIQEPRIGTSQEPRIFSIQESRLGTVPEKSFNSLENNSNLSENLKSIPQNDNILGIIVNEVSDSSTLFDMILTFKNLPFLIESVFKQLLQALNLLHINNIVHRDIKLENVLFSRSTGNITLIDFGEASYITSNVDECINNSDSVVGTISNFSPEIIYATKENRSILYLSDIWALGAIFYTILTEKYIIDDKKYPTLSSISSFFSSSEYCITRHMIEDLHYYPHNPKIVQGIQFCLTHSYQERLSASNILKILDWE